MGTQAAAATGAAADAAPTTLWRSMGRRRFLVSGWPWRGAGYLLTAAIMWCAIALPVAMLTAPWLILLVRINEGDLRPLGTSAALLLLGALLVGTAGPLLALPLAGVERWRLRLVDNTRSAQRAAVHRTPDRPGVWPWLRTRYTEGATWRAVGYMLLFAVAVPVAYPAMLAIALILVVFVLSPVLVTTGPIALGFDTINSVGHAVPYAVVGLILLPAIFYLVALLAGGHAEVARALLDGGRRDELHAQLVEVSRSRTRLVDAFETERRRIERDLHDGAQRRLLGLTLQLGMARLDAAPDSPAADAIADAHEQAKHLMAELRELVRGIYPKVLTDRGLPAALGALADECHLPVTVDAALAGRLPAPVESAVYFAVAEALTNATRHSGATQARVVARHDGDLLAVEVYDNGHGGADPQLGTGLTGLADRISAVGGRMLLSSPQGGPTLLRVEIACRTDR